MLKKIKETITNKCKVKQADQIVVGVSGGADSVYLLICLSGLRAELGFTLKAVHVHHGIRGSEADRDADFTAQLCSKLEVDFELAEVDAPAYGKERGLSLEEAARILRYECLNQSAGQAGLIAVAHNKNDQAETVIHNLLRGSGLAGTGGMTYRSGNIIRPLLDVSRAEIEAELAAMGQSYITDSTNLCDEYTRNKIRHELLPLFSEINEGALSHISDFAGDCRQAEDFIAGSAKAELEGCLSEGQASFEADRLLSLHPALRTRLIHQALSAVAGRSRDLTRAHIEGVLALATAKSGAQLSLPYNMIARKQYSRIIISKEGSAADREQRIEAEITRLNELLKETRSFKRDKALAIPQKEYTKWFDCDKIGGHLCWRRPMQGDLIVLDGVGTKTLSRFLIDNKVPRTEREELIVLADGNQVLWIPGYRISAAYKITDSTENIIEVKIREEALL